MKSGAIGAFLVVGAALVAALMIGTLLVGQGIPSSTTTTTTVVKTVSTTNSTTGLALSLTLNATRISSGEGFFVTAGEYNTRGAENNVTRGTDWKVSGVSVGGCGVQTFPFGVALFQGHDTTQNLSSAKQVQIFPFLACPLAIRYISGYLFEPLSARAIVLPSDNLSASFSTPMTANVTVTGQYSTGQKAQPLAPGSYTFVAADEWGNVVLLYVNVD